MKRTGTMQQSQTETRRIEQEPSDAGPIAEHRIDRRTVRLLQAFGYALKGLWYLLRTQRNAQIHCLIAACALALAAVLNLARWEWLVLVLTIVLVLAAEGFNTAIEATVDVATSHHHPLAAIAKDVAAGTVLLCAIGAVIVGCLLFLPHLWPIIVYFYESQVTGR
jgi:diacylglycerol kinase (ATP)